MSAKAPRVLALAGGVGGAKLAAGLADLLDGRLTVLVNTGDDFEHLGLHISPDLDTVMYTLAGLANPETGWGLAGESWQFIAQIERLGGPSWFRLGDRDLATHAIRTQRLAAGATLSAITSDFCRALGVSSTLLPMTDNRVRTMVHSEGRTLPFQDYFVRLKCEVPITGFAFEGAAGAQYNPALDRMTGPNAPQVIFICPSNPYVSIDPILALPGLRAWIKATRAPVVAVSPIVGGMALKGPAAKMMRELGIEPSAVNIARHYRGFIDGIIIDDTDAGSLAEISSLGMTAHHTQTVMRKHADRVSLARDCLALAETLAREAC